MPVFVALTTPLLSMLSPAPILTPPNTFELAVGNVYISLAIGLVTVTILPLAATLNPTKLKLVAFPTIVPALLVGI